MVPGLHGVGAADPVGAKEPAGQTLQSPTLVMASLRPGGSIAKLSSRRPGAEGGANGGANGVPVVGSFEEDPPAT